MRPTSHKNSILYQHEKVLEKKLTVPKNYPSLIHYRAFQQINKSHLPPNIVSVKGKGRGQVFHLGLDNLWF